MTTSVGGKIGGVSDNVNVEEWEARKKTFFTIFSEGKKVVDVFVIF
jgi:hypothetical protein